MYEVDVSDASKTFTYDANGNLTSDGTRSFEWDARNQLVAVTVGSHRSEFVYDGLRRRVRMVEKAAGVTQTDTRVPWCETAICEERAPDGVTVTRRAFGLGEQVAGQARFFATDHLGSVREVTDTAGMLLARYAFDPWGRRTVTAGSDVTTVGFTGHRTHTGAGLALALYRGYDAGVGRWVSEDPIGVSDGPNVYSYVGNSPTLSTDALGLAAGCCTESSASCAARCIERRRFDWSAFATATISKLPKKMLPPFRQVNPKQWGSTLLSSIANMTGGGGRSKAVGSALRTTGRALSWIGTPALIVEGLYDWYVIGDCIWRCQSDPCGE
jgi:RHS repeat-associated protein